ncbi:hypothetical protein OJAV_G00129750 [Oryzias javanicus]|uniref:Uncharacterized protein n=1 Tax=Oryzias javanicus TaxID=123683 RepID=A0A3S2PEN3_ORYJA|nr:hypothetical protein OJAV_G00129750 [Oryzias javanicus]
MLKPQGRADFLLHTSPPVFGKPWYWQRSSSTMESTRGLARVIMEMRDEIKKLETENRELRGGHARHPVGITPEEDSEEKEPLEIVENPYLNLRRNASAPVLEGKYKENAVMTVRRYSTSSNLSGVTTSGARIDAGSHNNSAWRRLQEELQQGEHVFSDKAEVQKVNSRHSLQEYVHKNRAKVKTVTFLLPVDDIYTSRPALIKHQEEPRVTDLASVTETDS